MSEPKKSADPSDSMSSMKFSQAFRMINLELFSKANKLFMAFGLTFFGLSMLYMANLPTMPEPIVREDYEGTFGSEQLIEKLLKDRKPKQVEAPQD